MATSSDEEKNKRTDAVSPDSSPDAKVPLHESTPQSPPTPPNGGLGAWLCVLGAFFIFTNTWGITASFGAFQSYYITTLPESASSISWIGSIQSFLVVFVGIVSGPLFDRGYIRILMATGCFLIVFGTMMLSLSTKYYQVILSQGIVIGLGAGLVYIPALAIISTQFTTKRPFAIGCASSGSSIGGIIFPIMFRRLEPKVGFGWAVRAIGFISLGTLAVSLAILSRHKRPKSATKRALFDFKAFTELPFLGFAVSLLLIFVAFYIPLFYIPSYAIYSLKIDETLSFYLLAITNSGSFFGRTVPFLIANRVGSIQIFVFWIVAAVIVMFSWLGIHNEAGFIVFCIIWGFISGVLVTAPAAAVAHPTLSPSMSVIGTRLGMSWITAAIGILIGPPIAGALVDLNTDYFVKAIVFAGVVMAAGAQPPPEIKRCISRYTTPHDWELADFNNIYSTNAANAPIYRVATSSTPPEPDFQSPPWQLDDFTAVQNGIIPPPQLPRKN
ncbi:hypothetical protein BGAL_0174g00130 [Botrytis galanthina]|uniref:Major facilitator superfamily (MFS) profile domain-containing protein n=1 Tax=Botrytis galanthina TaxID=278940 RepID=A0A4V4HUM7_9HELO|nr:hypothetical protein BGAL_0174g00130 [Botrytis galanthina]